MGTHVDGKNANGGGGSQNINVSQNIDINELAKALADKMGATGNLRRTNSGEEFVDTFDNEKSLESLAKSMTVQRGDNKSNFDDLGGIKETKKDKKQVDSTIDLLKGLD